MDNYDFVIVDMSITYGGVAVLTKDATNIPVFCNMGYGYAWCTRRIFWTNDGVGHHGGIRTEGTKANVDNGTCIPRFVYGVKL